MNAGGQATLLTYRLILLGLSPLVLFYTLYRSVKDGGFIYVLQRFGFSLPKNIARPTWIHCASVGEVNTALPLIQALVAKSPSTNFIISTTTPTGKNVLLKKQPNITHFYLPIDFSSSVRRTLKSICPTRLILVETEIWPNLIHQCQKSQVDVSIVNARLSAKTMNTYSWLRQAYSHSLKSISAVYAKNETESENFLQLGTPKEKVQVAGSLKFAVSNNSRCVETDIPQRAFFLAASTHDDEELRIVSEWKKANRSELLVIAPRHPERREQLTKQLESTRLNLQLRSQKKPLSPETQVYIVDTLGELDAFIQKATVVFVGGSLIPRGGQNIIEAARAGKAVLTGPSIENFHDEFSVLMAYDGIIQVDNEQKLIESVCRLLDNDVQRAALADNASKACRSQSDIVNKYAALLSEPS